jgi:hypothetical protein
VSLLLTGLSADDVHSFQVSLVIVVALGFNGGSWKLLRLFRHDSFNYLFLFINLMAEENPKISTPESNI